MDFTKTIINAIKYWVNSKLTSHIDDKDNPHGTTLKQLGVTATANKINNISNDAITNLSVNGKVITYTKGNGSTGTITTQDTDTIYTHPSYTARTGVPTANQIPAFGGSFKITQPVSNSTGHITAMNQRTITIPNTVATQSVDGLMSADDKIILDTLNTLVGDTAVSQQIDIAINNLATVATTGSYNDLIDKPTITSSFSFVDLVDMTQNITYRIAMRDGNLTIGLPIESIFVATPPTKIDYFDGDSFDTAGMVVMATTTNGASTEITNYTIQNSILFNGQTSIEIQYVDEYNITYTTSTPVSVVSLVDFEYTTNEDGTYTITGWKQTLNGELSTEMIIPDSPLIIL